MWNVLSSFAPQSPWRNPLLLSTYALSSTALDSVTFNSAQSVNTDYEHLNCPICFEAFDSIAGNGVVSLQCGHILCGTCLSNYLIHRILVEEDAFPTCYLSYCNVVTPNRILKNTLDGDVFDQVLRLQNGRQARSLDGIPLFCSTLSCSEAYQPLLPLDMTDPETEIRHLAPVVSCAGCESLICIECSQKAHEHKLCTNNSTVNVQAEKNSDYYQRLYATYAVGRIGACPRCKAHIARDGGCSTVTCRCGHKFTFRRFQSVEEVNGTLPRFENSSSSIRRPQYLAACLILLCYYLFVASCLLVPPVVLLVCCYDSPTVLICSIVYLSSGMCTFVCLFVNHVRSLTNR